MRGFLTVTPQLLAARVLADNADMFLLKNGWIMLAIKAQSIDVTKEPTQIYKQEIKTLQNRGFDVKQTVHLEPYDKAHAMIVGTKQKN
jgi:fibrillarin-like pre-rRNA processing protein